MQQSPLPEQHKAVPTSIYIVILLFATLANMTMDMYVPSLPAIAQTLQSSTSSVQLTLFFFMLGYSVSHLVFGPLSDRIGRRPPMLAGIGLNIVGSLICAFAPSIFILIIGRFVQGVGVSVCNSVGRTLVRDLVAGPHLARVSSFLGMIMVVVIASAPTLGGYIQYYFNWRAVFGFLFIYTIFVLIFVWKYLPETNLSLNPHATKIKILLRNYFTVLTNKVFLGYTLCVAFAYAGIFAYVTCAPFIFQTVLGLTPVQYGWLAFVIGAAIFLSFLINSQLVMKLGIEKMVFVATCLMLTGGIVMLALALLGFINIVVIMLPLALFCMGAGLNFANASAGAFQPLPKLAGSVGALFGCIQIFGGAAASAIMASLHVKNQIPLAMILVTISIAALLAWKYLATQPTGEVAG